MLHKVTLLVRERDQSGICPLCQFFWPLQLQGCLTPLFSHLTSHPRAIFAGLTSKASQTLTTSSRHTIPSSKSLSWISAMAFSLVSHSHPVPGLSALHITVIVILVKQAKPYPAPAQTFQQLLTSLSIKSQVLPGVIRSNQLLFLLTSVLSSIHILGTVPQLSTVPQLLKHTPCSSPLWLLPQTSHFFLVLCS